MKNNLSSRPKQAERSSFIVISSLVWSYLWLRAIWVPMAHDEVATFFYYIQTGRFLPFLSHWDMNNHFLNSALGTLSYHLFGSSPLALRLPNLLFFPLFVFFLWKTGQLIPGWVARWFFYISLLLSHGFVEFFSLSRGYGMSMAMLMGMLYYTVLMTRDFLPRPLSRATLWALLATVSNLSLLYSLLLFMGWSLLLIRYRYNPHQRNGKIFLSLKFLGWTVPVLAFLGIYAFLSRDKGLLYTGGASGIWDITVKSLITVLTQVEYPLAYYVLGALSLALCGYVLYRLVRNHDLLQEQLAFPFFLFGNLCAFWILHVAFGVNYPENRVALYLFPLFTGALCLAAGDLSTPPGRSVWLLLLAPLVFFPVHFFCHLNLSFADSYKEDPVPESFYRKVRSAHRPGEYPPVVGGPRLRHFCWAFHDYRNGGTESPLVWTGYPDTLADFQIADSPDLKFFKSLYRPVDSVPIIHRYLMERKVLLQKVVLMDHLNHSLEISHGQEFSTLFLGTADTLIGQSLYIGLEGRISSPAKPLEAWIVAEVKDREGKSLRYEFLSLNWLRPEWQGASGYLKSGLVLAQLPGKSHTLVLYIWNPGLKPISLNRFECRIFLYR